MTLRKTSISLGSVAVALATASLTDTALAGSGGTYFDSGGFLYRAPQPMPGAAPRPFDRDMRGAPSIGGRGMRGGMGGGRMNGGMGGRR